MADRVDRFFCCVRGVGCVIGAALALGLSGCAGIDDTTSYALVLQDRYAYMSCTEIEGQQKGLIARERQLLGLLEKAESGGIGGALVGATTYRSELTQVRAQLKFANRSAQDKGCGAPAKR